MRRGRWFWLAWVLALAAVVPATAAAYERFIPDSPQAGLVIEGLTANPTMRAMLGPPFSLEDAGGFTVWRVGTFVVVLAGVMAVLGVVQATRADEEEGRTELVRSAAVGRHAPLAAAVLVALGACALLGGLITAGMVVVGTEAAGSLAFGAGTALCATVFVGVGAVTAQLTGSARAARGMGLAVLGAAYLLRALGDGVAEGSDVQDVRWLSPVEWMALARPYAGERWAVLLLPAALTGVLLAAAVLLESRRDHGSGLWHAPSPGPAAAAPSLSSPAALAWRLQRGSVTGWTVGVLLFSVLIGSLAPSFAAMMTDLPQLGAILRRVGGGAEQLSQAFYVAMQSILVLLIAALGVQLLGRLRQEETLGRAEAVLATAVPRTRLAGSHLLPALAVPSVLFVVAAAAMTLPKVIDDGDWGVVGQEAGAAAVLLPGVWVCVGVAMLLLGWAPAHTGLAWLLIAWSLFVTWVGAVLGLPQWLAELTPFARLPALPVEPMAWTPVVVTTSVAAVLLTLGLVGYRRRDLPSSA